MGANYQLTATVREKVGKGAARAVRRQGLIPAVIYGGKEPPISIPLSGRDVYFKIHGGGFITTVAEIGVNGETIRTLPRDFQLDPVTDRPIHVDFLRITAGSTITVEVPVHFVNEADSPRHQARRRAQRRPPPGRTGLPGGQHSQHIVADLTGLDINDSLHISAIELPEGVKPTIDRDFTVATIAAPAGIKEEIRAAADAAAAAETAAGEAKAEGGDAKKADGAKRKAEATARSSPATPGAGRGAMLLLVGLGNPGPEYAAHRHNVGFMARRCDPPPPRLQPVAAEIPGEIAEGTFAGEKCLLLKPQTYMNESGRAVGEAMRFYKLAPEDVLVIHDEVDLPPGKIRMKAGGGAAGHNGLRSIAGAIGDGFRRLRIGVGHPGVKEAVPHYVLHDFAKADRAWLEPLIDAIADHAAAARRRQGPDLREPHP